MSKKLVKFRVHVGGFLDEKGEMPKNAKRFLFLNVRNDGTKPITIDAVKSKHSGNWKKIKNPERPVPIVLEPGKEWETWTRETSKNRNNYYDFLVMYKTFSENWRCLLATKRYNVPRKGEVPTGK